MKRAQAKIKPYTAPTGGWGSAGSVANFAQEHAVLGGLHLLPFQNKPNGYACVSCAWVKPAEPRPLEFCENGAPRD